MQRWKEEFVGNAHKKCVQINRNGVFDQGKGMHSPAQMPKMFVYLLYCNASFIYGAGLGLS